MKNLALKSSLWLLLFVVSNQLAYSNPPEAVIDSPDPLYVLVNSQTNFDGSKSIYSDGNNISYEWDFDYDGSTFSSDDSGAIVNFTFQKTGTYDIALRVTDSNLSDIDIITANVINIVPEPQTANSLSTTNVTIDSSWVVVCDESNPYELYTANYLVNDFNDIGYSLDIVDVNDANLPSECRIVIGNPNENTVIANIANSHGINISTDLANDDYNQGYVLITDPNEIVIAANSTSGSFYGMISLTWLLNDYNDLVYVPHLELKDWPDLEIRGFYGGGLFNWEDKWRNADINTSTNWQEWTDVLARYKYNLWTSSISLSDGYEDRKAYLQNNHFRTCVDLKLGGLRYIDPNYFEGLYAQNVSLSFDANDIAVPQEDAFSYYFGFEDGNFPENWDIDDITEDPCDYWMIDSNDSCSGDYSIKLVLNRDNSVTCTSSSYMRSEKYPMEPNRIYNVTFWAKVSLNGGDNGHYPQLTIVPRDENGEVLYTLSRVIDANVWTYYSMIVSSNNNEKEFSMYSRAQWTKELEFWIDDIQMVRLDNKLRNVINTGGSLVDVYNNSRTEKYTEGVDYQLTKIGDPDYYYPLLFGEELRIERLAGGGITEPNIVVDYDFVANFQHTRNEYITLSAPNLLIAYNDWISDEMNEIEPEYVFIGMDEIRGFNRDSRAQAVGDENHKVLGDFLHNVIDIIHAYDSNTTVLIWDDMINPYHNGGNEDYQVPYGGQPGKSWYALDLIQQENVAMICWKYDTELFNPDKLYSYKIVMSPQLYDVMGFEFLGGPWSEPENIKWWSYLAYTYDALGMIEHEFYNDVSGVADAANYAWNAVKTAQDANMPSNPYGPDDPQDIDTDGDGLSDYDELTLYMTDLSEIDPNAHWWRLDETSGVTAYDSIDDDDGTFNGTDPCWVDGIINGAIECNGVSDYFSVSSLNSQYSPYYNSVFSVAGWFKTSQSAGMQTVVANWNNYEVVPGSTLWFGWQVLVENNKVVARFGPASGYTKDITGNTDVNDGDWHHFALVFCSQFSDSKLYVDGQLDAEPDTVYGILSNTKFRIGDASYVSSGNPVLKGGPFNGTIDDIMLFDYTLNEQEVYQLYENGK